MCDIQISYKGAVIVTGKTHYIPRIGMKEYWFDGDKCIEEV